MQLSSILNSCQKWCFFTIYLVIRHERPAEPSTAHCFPLTWGNDNNLSPTPPNDIGNAFFVSHWTVKYEPNVVSFAFMRRMMLSPSFSNVQWLLGTLNTCPHVNTYYGREGKRETTTHDQMMKIDTHFVHDLRPCGVYVIEYEEHCARTNERRSSAIHVSPIGYHNLNSRTEKHFSRRELSCTVRVDFGASGVTRFVRIECYNRRHVHGMNVCKV